MRLSKQERMAVLIIAVIIILGLGIFLFIVPQFQSIGTSNASLESKKKELADAQAKAATVVDLGTQVNDAYKQGNKLADMFFEEMKDYEADDQIRDFIQFCKDSGLKCSVDSITIGTPTVGNLGVTFNEESEITYDLKTAARGDSANGEQTDEQRREEILQNALANTQTVGAIDVTFNVTTLEPDDLIKFIDLINNYEINGVRKAMRLSSGIEIEFADVAVKYQKVIDDMTLDLTFDALKEVADENGKKFPTKQELKEKLGLVKTTGEGDGDGDTAAAQPADDLMYDIGDDEIYTAELTITMYSLERMQDPTNKLAEQNALLG